MIMRKEITKNSAMCLLCKDVLVSKNRHDFVTCACGNLSVDGGNDYLKRSVMDTESYLDLSEYIEYEVEDE
jgi:hypothetical protein